MTPSPERRVPSGGRLLGRALLLRCPLCGHHPIFRHHLGMDDRCTSCGLVFERVVGQWYGSLTLNTIVSFGVLLAVILGSFLAWWPEAPPSGLLVVALGVALVVPVVFFPWSRTLWLALDLRLRPLEVDEACGPRPAPEPTPSEDH